MATAFRADLQPFLADFVEQHRGLRIGKMFGRPAGYAGRKMFVCLMDDGVIVKLPARIAKDEVRAGRACRDSGFGTRDSNPQSRIPNPGSVWIKYSPRSASEAGRLAPILELAARYVAEAA